jgi:hypothetical protein
MELEKCLLRKFYFIIIIFELDQNFPPLISFDTLRRSLIFIYSRHKHIVLNPRSAIILIITKRVVVIHFRRFGTTYLSHLQGLKMSRIVGMELPLLVA